MEKDAKKAREYLEKVAQQNIEPGLQETAQQKLAELKILSASTPTAAQPSQAVNEKIKKLESTDVDPKTRANNLLQLGEIYLFGNDVTKDVQKALKYFEMAAKEDVNPQAQARANYQLGIIYLGIRDVKNEKLGEMYMLAKQEMKKYIPQAVSYLEQAATQQVEPIIWARANYFLGLIYYENLDVKNDCKAIDHLEKAANQDVDATSQAYARLTLGDLYHWGHGVAKRNDVIAAEYFKLVANQNKNLSIRARANNSLGVIYHNGLHGMKKDDTKAQEYFEKAADQTDDPEMAKKAQEHLMNLLAEKIVILKTKDLEALKILRDLELLVSIGSKAQDFLDTAKVIEQYETEFKGNIDENIKQQLVTLKKDLQKVKDAFVKMQESKVSSLVIKPATPPLIKAAKKAISELETLHMPELATEIQLLKTKVAKWSKPSAVTIEPTDEEKKAQQEQQTRQARNLMKELDEALENKELDVAEQKLLDIQQLTISDADIRKQIAILQNQYKKQKADALQIEFEEALAKYKEKPSSARADNVKDIIRALADLKIAERRDFINKANQQWRSLEKESAIVPEKKRISPTPAPAPEPQQLLFIFDPYNQLEPLPKEIKSRAKEALKKLSLGYKNSSAVELKGKGLEGLWRIRIGNYRIVYKMLREKDAIAVVMIDARGEIYETEDEQLQKTRNADLIDIDVWQIDKLLEDAKDLLKGEDVSVAKAAYAESLLELYRWQLRGYPPDEEYLNSLLFSGKAAFKMNDLAKARERFADLIPQSIDFPKIKKQAQASLAEVEKRITSFHMGRTISTSQARVSPISQEDVVGKLRDKYQEARQLLVINPEKATLALEQFSKESSGHAAELTNERRGADTLLNNEPIFVSAEQALEEGEYDDAITFFNTYLKEVGKFIPTHRRQLIDEEIAQSELGRAIRREVEKRLVK